jgi:diacylglycerol diphosphate phosphatase/phosphatidate phosphatase
VVLYCVALLIPIPILAVVNVATFKRLDAYDLHQAMCGLLESFSLSKLITEVLQVTTGALRPDFLDRCRWDPVETDCTGLEEAIDFGRRSFPSLHASVAFGGMFYVSLYVAAKLGVFAAEEDSDFYQLLLVIAPCFSAALVAVTRSQVCSHSSDR